MLTTIINIVLYVQESRRKHDHNVERNVRYKKDASENSGVKI